MTPDTVTAIVHLLPALVWSVIARELWVTLREVGVERTLLRVATFLAVAQAAHFVLHALVALTPTELDGRLPGLHAACESLIHVSIIATLVLFRHLVPLLANPQEQPTRRWLAAHYGVAAVVSFVALLPIFVPRWRLAEGWYSPHVPPILYAAVMSFLALRHAWRLARRGRWRPGPAVGELHSADVVVIGGALLGTGGMLIALVLAGNIPPTSTPSLLLHTAVGLGVAVPFAVRMLGRVVRSVLVAGTLAIAGLALFVVTRALAARAPGPELARLVDLVGVAAAIIVFLPGRRWVEATVERALFRRARHRQAVLQDFLQTLSPELGPLECCRRALHEFGRLTALRGAAIVLRDGATAVYGEFRVAPLERAWPRGEAADALPIDAASEGELWRALPAPLREALAEAEVTWIAGIASRRRRWGYLFASENLLAAASSVDDFREIGAFARQLALVLDAADLLARAVAVERSLAHAEKLAAIGETAARIAHDIRNPVTAARSLAQQLAREPAAPFRAEHEVILGELDRVERQVRDLLRFARRDEPRRETVELGELIHATIEQCRARIEAAGVRVEVTAPAGVAAHVDREKIRQALMNLIENAVEALAGHPAPRRLALALLATDGTATLRVSDNGPGVPADALPHLFEPFFTLKEHGTGLGLAIARRTVEAHGGRIDAASPPGGGMAIHVELPLTRTTSA